MFVCVPSALRCVLDHLVLEAVLGQDAVLPLYQLVFDGQLEPGNGSKHNDCEKRTRI